MNLLWLLSIYISSWWTGQVHVVSPLVSSTRHTCNDQISLGKKVQIHRGQFKMQDALGFQNIDVLWCLPYLTSTNCWGRQSHSQTLEIQWYESSLIGSLRAWRTWLCDLARLAHRCCRSVCAVIAWSGRGQAELAEWRAHCWVMLRWCQNVQWSTLQLFVKTCTINVNYK